MPERISAYIGGSGLGCFELHPNIPLTTEYIRADVAQAQLDAANKRIAELEAAQQWISVDERLPEPGDIVLACLPDYEELVIVNKWPKRQATSRVGSSWHESSRVTHWMPLPPPPVTP